MPVTDNRDENLDRVVADLLSVPPLLFRSVRRKLFEATRAGVDLNITPLHFEIMFHLDRDGTMHIAEIGDRLQIARAQMTQLIDKLADLKMVKRQSDEHDRRVMNITLTRKGHIYIKEQTSSLNNVTREILSSLDASEMEQISTSLRKLRDTLIKS
jgi:DNA-binding MarR family transcriptional regulator